MIDTQDASVRVLERLVDAVNARDLDALVECFAEDYVNQTPAHPARGFRGREQVRKNWTRIFAAVTDLKARAPRAVVDRDAVWVEWELGGTRADGEPFGMRGVVIFTVAADRLASARFYVEPVDNSDGDVDEHTSRVVGVRRDKS